MSLLTDLQAAGLPVLFATDGYNAMFSRGLTDAENEIYLNILFPQRAAQIARGANAKGIAKAIPNWATWTQAEWQTFFDANLSTTQVASVIDLASARAMLNKQNLVIQNLVKMVLAIRDSTWPDL